MPNFNQTLEDKKNSKKNPRKSPSGKEPHRQADINLPIVESKNPHDQASRLDEGNLHQPQRHALAHQIGRVQGNHHLQQVVSNLKENGQTALGNQVVQRELLGDQRINRERIELRVSMPASINTFVMDVTQGLSHYVSRVRLVAFTQSLRPALMDYYRSLEGSESELTSITLEIGLNTTDVRADLLRVTDPSNQGEMIPMGVETSSSAATEDAPESAVSETPTSATASAPARASEDEVQAETPAPTTASAPASSSEEEVQAETPAPTTTSAPARTGEDEVQAETPAPTTDSTPARTGEEEVQAETPAPETASEPAHSGEEEVQAEAPAPETASASDRSPEEESQAQIPTPAPSSSGQQLPTIRTPYTATETVLPPVTAGPVLIHPTYKLGGNFDIRPAGPATAQEFRANLRAGSPEIQQTFQDEFRQMGIEYTADGPSLSIGDRRINMEMSIKPGYVLEFKTPVFQINRRVGNCNIQANMAVTLALRFTGNPAVLEAIMLAAGAAASVALFIHTISQIGTSLAGAVESIFVGLAGIGSRIVIPVIFIPREALEEMMETGPHGVRDGGIA